MKNRKFKKILFILALSLCLALIIPFTAFCASDAISAQTEANIFSEIFEAARSNSENIFSVLAFIGSLVIMFCYKKGLIPFIKDALGKLSAGVKSINDKTVSLGRESETLTAALTERLDTIDKLSKKLDETASALVLSQEEINGYIKDRERFNAVLLSQIDMLYEIFMSASLPQYLKDRVGTKINEMKKTVEESGACDGE